MTDSHHPWTDADVDRALTRFFAAECPPELPGATPRAAVTRRPAPPRSVRRTSAFAVVSTMAAAVVAAAWLIMIAPADRRSAKLTGIAPTTPREVVITMSEPGPREIFATSAGLMQQQTELKVTTVSWVAPDSGDAIEWQIPELAIDIVPVVARDQGELR